MVLRRDDMADRKEEIGEVEVPEELESGQYSNAAYAHVSPFEVVIDFARVTPGSKRARVVTRVVMSPQHAKALMQMLRDQVEQYEKQIGALPALQAGTRESARQIGFKAPTGPAKED
jgi:hypothetical protein